ncbi:MAG: GNAT family N-acetyltransferase [Phycisphaerae bacterium]|nr:GNAT family N-acetyltransferase [Phycisphaerae bacterium]
MRTRKLDDKNKAEYEDLAKKYGTIFNTLDWLKIFGDNVQVCGIYNKGDNLIGGFTFYEERKFGLRIFRNPRFTPTIGPFLEIKAKNPVAIMNTWKEALSSMAEFIEGMPYSIISFSLNKNIVDTQPFLWKKFKVTPGYTYLLDMSKSTDDIWAEMSAERRNDMNKATRDGLIVKQAENYEIAKSLVLKTFSRQNLTVKEHYLEKILFEFANNANSFAFTTYKDDNPIAVSFCVCDKKTAYYLLGGYDYERKHHGAGALAVWEAIKYAQQLGLSYFDFEGSMVPQIERYFRGFGGKLTPCYSINKAKLPLEILLKFFKRERF